MTIFGCLGILFIALKLMHYIDWSWWLVLLPMYAGFAIAGIALVIAGIYKVFGD